MILASIGSFFADRFRRWLPDSLVFAILLTFLSAVLALIVVDGTTPTGVLDAWQKGFWDLLQFGMQMVLILATGYAIAISPPTWRRYARWWWRPRRCGPMNSGSWPRCSRMSPG